MQGSAWVQVFALDWEAEGHLGVGGRVFEGGGHFEGFHPVQVEGGWVVFFGVGDDLGRFWVSFRLCCLFSGMGEMRWIECVLMLTFRAMGPSVKANFI